MTETGRTETVQHGELERLLLRNLTLYGRSDTEDHTHQGSSSLCRSQWRRR